MRNEMPCGATLLSQATLNVAEGAVLVLVGSFAPPHRSDVPVAEAAMRMLAAHREAVRALVVVPNRDSYVQIKIGDTRSRLDLGTG